MKINKHFFSQHWNKVTINLLVYLHLCLWEPFVCIGHSLLLRLQGRQPRNCNVILPEATEFISKASNPPLEATRPPIQWAILIFDMDMSNGWRVSKIWRVTMRVRVRSDAHSHSHKLRHAAAAMRANNVLRNRYNTRPLLCAPITCYVTVITHAHCNARA
jgi:hypothetical protein